MAKQDSILWIVGIGLILLVVLSQSNLFKQQEEGMIGLNVHYYKDGVEVFPTKSLFSIVTPPGGSYDQIAFDVTVKNTGDLPFQMLKFILPLHQYSILLSLQQLKH